MFSSNLYHTNFELSTKIESACASESMEDSLCYSSHRSDLNGYKSCVCQPQIISLDYMCEYLGNKSCQLTTADLTNLELYPLCSNLLESLVEVGAL